MIPGLNSQARPETIEEAEVRKVALFKEISSLGQILEDLDEVVNNHEAQNEKYADLTQDIIDKETVRDLLSPEVQKLAEEKIKLENECKSIQTSIEEKTKLSEEIIQLKTIVKTLQQEEREYRSAFEILKEKSTAEIRNAKDKLKFLSATISSVLAQL